MSEADVEARLVKLGERIRVSNPPEFSRTRDRLSRPRILTSAAVIAVLASGAAIGAIGLSANDPDIDRTGRQDVAAATEKTPAAIPPLLEGPWDLSNIVGPDGVVNDAEDVTLQFGAETFVSIGGCNTYSGGYSQSSDGRALIFDMQNVGSSLRDCGRIDRDIMNFLTRSTSLAGDGNSLEVRDAHGVVVGTLTAR